MKKLHMIAMVIFVISQSISFYDFGYEAKKIEFETLSANIKEDTTKANQVLANICSVDADYEILDMYEETYMNPLQSKVKQLRDKGEELKSILDNIFYKNIICLFLYLTALSLVVYESFRRVHS